MQEVQHGRWRVDLRHGPDDSLVPELETAREFVEGLGDITLNWIKVLVYLGTS